jgi:hypothetical protein
MRCFHLPSFSNDWPSARGSALAEIFIRRIIRQVADSPPPGTVVFAPRRCPLSFVPPASRRLFAPAVALRCHSDDDPTRVGGGICVCAQLPLELGRYRRASGAFDA